MVVAKNAITTPHGAMIGKTSFIKTHLLQGKIVIVKREEDQNALSKAVIRKIY